MTGELATRLDTVRRELPGGMAAATQLVLDNPGSFAVGLSGGIVLGKILLNLVKPRTITEALAVVIMTGWGTGFATRYAMDHGYLTFKYRDADGQLVSLVPDASKS